MIKDCEILPVETCKEDDLVIEVSKRLKEKNLRHLFVVDDEKKPKGVISTVDICYKGIADGKDIVKAKVKEIMTAPLQYADINDPSEVALYIMMQKNTFSCPITDDKKFIGMITLNEAFNKVKTKVMVGK